MNMGSRKNSFESDIILGKEYIDDQTGFKGIAVGVYFFQHACERVNLEARVNADGKIIDNTFDAPRLRQVGDEAPARSSRPGGPGRSGEGNRGVDGRR